MPAAAATEDVSVQAISDAVYDKGSAWIEADFPRSLEWIAQAFRRCAFFRDTFSLGFDSRTMSRLSDPRIYRRIL